MKKLKKVFSLLFALVMALAMNVTVFASGDTGEGTVDTNPPATSTTYTITIANVPTASHTFGAYHVFAGDLTDNVLSNITWGTGVNGESLLAALKNLEITKDQSKTKPFADCKSAQDVAKNLTTYSNNSAVLDKVASIVSNNLNEDGVTLSSDTVTGSEKAYTYTILNLDAGYYFVKDEEELSADSDDAYTKFMLQLTKNAEVEIKTDVPTSEKKVDDVNDSNKSEDDVNWQDSADYDIGDEIPYKLTANLPDNVSAYGTYTLQFVDTMSKGLTYVKDSAEVYVGNQKIQKVEPTTTNCADTEGKYVGGTVLTWDLGNIKADPYNAGDNAQIRIEYKATLNNDAVIGSAGNPNKMHIVYSNNPNATGTGQTPDDTNIVFTYKVIVNKQDEDKRPLDGATFALDKFVQDENGTDTYKDQKGTWVTKAVVEEPEGYTFTWNGLDDGEYRIRETEAPSTYNKIDDIYFTVTANHDVLSDNPVLNSLNGTPTITGEITFTSNTTNGSLSTNVINKKGATLPETGGIGTRIFYAVGAVLMIGAAVLLITRKRTEKNQ